MSGAVLALAGCGNPLALNWKEESYGWEYRHQTKKSSVTFAGGADFEANFIQNPLLLDVAVMVLIAGTYALEQHEPAYISEQSIINALDFKSYGKKRASIREQIETSVKTLNSLQVCYENLISRNKRKPFENSSDFLVHMHPISGLTKHRHWALELGEWTHMYLNSRNYKWQASLPRQVLTLKNHVNAQRIAKRLAYHLIGFSGGTHQFQDGMTKRKVKALLAVAGETLTSDDPERVKNWKRRVKQDLEKAFGMLCQQGFMASVKYDLPQSLGRYWSNQWFQSTVKFVYNTQP